MRKSAPASSSARALSSGICTTCSASWGSVRAGSWRTSWAALHRSWPRRDVRREGKCLAVSTARSRSQGSWPPDRAEQCTEKCEQQVAPENASPITTPPSEGRMSRPENGGASNAVGASPSISAPNTLPATRCSNSRLPARTARTTAAPQQRGQQFLPRGWAKLEPLPARRQPDASAADAELRRDHSLEDVRSAAGRERQCGQRHEQHEDEREAAWLEQLDEVAEGLRLIAPEPVFELVADRR